MKIIYVARHDQESSNDDEGAITHALTELGHDVTRLREVRGHKVHHLNGDMLLFHKWYNLCMFKIMKARMPVVFWYFDLVDYPDPLLGFRNATRSQWMTSILPFVSMGFCTDGDWVAADTSGKLIHLMQGADERFIKPLPSTQDQPIDILFTGSVVKCGEGRASFVEELTRRYGRRFKHVESGVHGEELGKLLRSAKIVVAPDHPCTDRYHSNRLYLTAGFGGFLMHPYSELASAHYADGHEVVLYKNRADLYTKINHYLGAWVGQRREIAQRAMQRTLAEHTYRHRLVQLLDQVKERTRARTHR